MTDDLYSGAIDWDRIYRTFHSPMQISKRIREELDGAKQPVIFSGFLETAAYLAEEMPVIFVDHSLTITGKAKSQYPQLHDVQTGDVTQRVSSLHAPNIVIACRISAYWDSADYFERLAHSLSSLPRDHVLIDFFDLELIEPGQKLTFEAEDGNGVWEFLKVEEANGIAPTICKVKLKVSYTLKDKSHSYEGYRSFFKKDDLLRWCRAKLPDYAVALGAPLMDQDPGFTLKLISK